MKYLIDFKYLMKETQSSLYKRGENMKYIILRCDTPECPRDALLSLAKRYESMLNPGIKEKEYCVIPLFYGLSMQKIEEDIDGFDFYIKELQEIRKELELKE